VTTLDTVDNFNVGSLHQCITALHHRTSPLTRPTHLWCFSIILLPAIFTNYISFIFIYLFIYLFV